MMNGNDKQKCNRDAKWDGDMPQCNCKCTIHVIISNNRTLIKLSIHFPDIDCNRVQTIFKGEVKYVNSTTHLGSILKYSCSFGFKLSGSGQRTCREDGKWSDSSPKCEEIRCVPPVVPRNSSVVYSGNDRSTSDSFIVGSTVQYRCALGHIVRGQSLRTCEHDGNWSGSPPVCVYMDCGWPYVISHGRWLLTTNATYYGSTVEYECTGAFKLTGPARRICMENGTWSQMGPTCETVNCGQPPTKDEKTVVEGNVFAVGERVSYSCQYGYELVGEEQRICANDGQWSHETPYCRGTYNLHCSCTLVYTVQVDYVNDC